MYKPLLSTCLALCLLSGCAMFGGDSDPAKSAPESEVKSDAATDTNMAAAHETKSKKHASRKSEATIRQELDATAKKLLARASRTITPNKNSKSVRKEGKDYVASYIGIDPNAYSIEMRPSSRAGEYNGFIRYSEQTYQCRGKTRQEALKASCVPHGSRRMNEMIHYDGNQWHY